MTRLCLFAALRQTLKGILTNAFKHHKARLPRAVLLLLQQTLVHQRRESCQHIQSQIAAGIAYGLGAFERAAAGKDGQSSEQPLLGRGSTERGSRPQYYEVSAAVNADRERRLPEGPGFVRVSAVSRPAEAFVWQRLRARWLVVIRQGERRFRPRHDGSMRLARTRNPRQ